MGLAITIPRPPQRLTLDPLLSDAEFEELCFANSDLQVERTKDGVIVVHAPTGLGSGSGNSIIAYQLTGWWLGHRRGRVTDSNTGFFLPDGSMLSPDAAYITAEQEATLNNEDLKHFGRMTPAFVIELRSQSDSLPELERKMETWIANGAQVGWLVDPYAQAVTVYESGRSPGMEAGASIPGNGPVEGFLLDLGEIWRCFVIE
ncbi:MAG TPA: Uma2 family endonuclease [Acidobacteriaceae bacterium]